MMDIRSPILRAADRQEIHVIEPSPPKPQPTKRVVHKKKKKVVKRVIKKRVIKKRQASVQKPETQVASPEPESEPILTPAAAVQQEQERGLTADDMGSLFFCAVGMALTCLAFALSASQDVCDVTSARLNAVMDLLGMEAVKLKSDMFPYGPVMLLSFFSFAVINYVIRNIYRGADLFPNVSEDDALFKPSNTGMATRFTRLLFALNTFVWIFLLQSVDRVNEYKVVYGCGISFLSARIVTDHLFITVYDLTRTFSMICGLSLALLSDHLLELSGPSNILNEALQSTSDWFPEHMHRVWHAVNAVTVMGILAELADFFNNEDAWNAFYVAVRVLCVFFLALTGYTCLEDTTVSAGIALCFLSIDYFLFIVDDFTCTTKRMLSM